MKPKNQTPYLDRLKALEGVPLTTKQCTKCGAIKLLTDFYTTDFGRYVRGCCKQCQREYIGNYRQAKKGKAMSELISSKQIAEEFKLAAPLVISYLEAAKLAAHKLVVGTEAMSLYDKAAAFKAVEARVKEEKEIHAANLARIEAAKIPTIKDVMTAIKVLAADVADVAELQDEIRLLKAANQGMFKALTDFKSDTADRLAGIKTIIINMRDEKSTPICESSSILPKVAVVGIGVAHHASIAAEFGALVNLKLLDASDIRGIYGLRGYAKVFVMRKTTDYKHTEQLKAVKASAEPVNGSIEELREKLTNYCLTAT